MDLLIWDDRKDKGIGDDFEQVKVRPKAIDRIASETSLIEG